MFSEEVSRALGRRRLSRLMRSALDFALPLLDILRCRMGRFLFHCVFALLLSFPAPLPVEHSHAAYLEDSTGWRLLAEHVSLFHGSQQPLSVEPETPHSHWLFVLAGLEAPLLGAPADLGEGATAWLATPDSLILLLCFGASSPLDDAPPPLRGSKRLDSEYDNGRPGVSGLAFHRLFCVWTC